MESNALLIRAASGLERLMVGRSQKGILQDSVVAQVSAAIYYQAHVLDKLMSNRTLQSKFQTVIFNQVRLDFYNYIDAMARVKPKQYHHLYEWQRTGEPSARLFQVVMLPSNFFGVNMTYKFMPSKSKVPNSKSRRTHIFTNKASVMEANLPVVISPRYSERLVFDTKTHTVFMPKGKSVTVTKPGGIATKDSLKTSYRIFFTGNLVNESIKRSGFQNMFRSSAARALRLPSDIKKVKYTFSPNTVRLMAENSVNSVGVI